MTSHELAAAIEARKEEHLWYARGDVEARTPAGWDDIELVHQAVPEVDLDEGLRRTIAWMRERPERFDPDAYRI